MDVCRHPDLRHNDDADIVQLVLCDTKASRLTEQKQKTDSWTAKCSFVILNSKTVRYLPRLVLMRLERFSLPKSL